MVVLLDLKEWISSDLSGRWEWFLREEPTCPSQGMSAPWSCSEEAGVLAGKERALSPFAFLFCEVSG